MFIYLFIFCVYWDIHDYDAEYMDKDIECIEKNWLICGEKFFMGISTLTPPCVYKSEVQINLIIFKGTRETEWVQ